MPGHFSELGEAGVDSGVESTLLATICVMTLICMMFSVPWFPHLSNHHHNRTDLLAGAAKRTKHSSTCSPSLSSHRRCALSPAGRVLGRTAGPGMGRGVSG